MASFSHTLKEKLLAAAKQAEHRLSMGKFKLKDRLNLLEPINIMPYYGFGSAHYVYVKGRVMEDEHVAKPKEDGSLPTHLEDTYKRYESDEIPGIKLKASFGGQEQTVQTNEEGFFEVEFRSEAPIDYSATGHYIKLKLLESKTPNDDLEAEAYIFTPGKDAEFGIISDIDDTVLVSHISHLLEQLKVVLLQNALERSPFPGIAGFLRALCNGSDGNGQNPLFFVSGSEWNLYNLLVDFLRAHDIPEGPLLLRDKGIRFDKGAPETEKQGSKREKIRHILDTYPHLRFICIGDSGQQDPGIYQQVVQEYPGRILGVYIRDVTPDKRDEQVNEIARQVREQGVEMELVEETVSAAHHAVKQGWINKDQLQDVQQACEQDERRQQ